MAQRVRSLICLPVYKTSVLCLSFFIIIICGVTKLHCLISCMDAWMRPSQSPYIYITSLVRRADPLWWWNGRCRGSDVHVRSTRSSAAASGPSLEQWAASPRQPALRGPRTPQHHAQQHGVRCQWRSEKGQRPNIWVGLMFLISVSIPLCQLYLVNIWCRIWFKLWQKIATLNFARHLSHFWLKMLSVMYRPSYVVFIKGHGQNRQ